MRKVYFVLASLFLLASCSGNTVVRDDLYDSKIMIIEENHEKLIEVTTVGEVIEVLEAVKAGCQTEDARIELAYMLKENTDTVSIRHSSEKLARATNTFIQRAGIKLQDMHPTVEESSQIIGLVKSIRTSNKAYKSASDVKKEKKESVDKDENPDEELNVDIETLMTFDYESLLVLETYLQFFTDENGNFDLENSIDTAGKILKIIGVVATFF